MKQDKIMIALALTMATGIYGVESTEQNVQKRTPAEMATIYVKQFLQVGNYVDTNESISEKDVKVWFKSCHDSLNKKNELTDEEIIIGINECINPFYNNLKIETHLDFINKQTPEKASEIGYMLAQFENELKKVKKELLQLIKYRAKLQKYINKTSAK
jgi:hypothetical protein